jgi:RNA polymerase sigma factor (sigma-70 family)
VADSLPAELARLLDAREIDAREHAWAEFVRIHTSLLLKVARATTHEYDVAMDAYAFILEQLRKGDCHRLRGYVVDPRSTFSTWLAVVSRRLCLDFARHRYGRGGRSETTADERRERRRLVDLAAAEIDLASIPDPSGATPETELDAADLRQLLVQAIGELEPADRLLLALRFEDGLTAELIATTLQLPSPFHVYRRLKRVLGTLRTRLVGQSVDRGRKASAGVRLS